MLRYIILFSLDLFFLVTKVTSAHSNFFLADLRGEGIADGEAGWGGEVKAPHG